MSASYPVVEHLDGPVARLHGRAVPDPAVAAVWCLRVSRPAMVLGSSQPDTVDRGAAAARGADVVRRRSGGGAVWLAPGEVLWVDVIVPAGHRLWDDDVGRAFGWVGRAWAEALGGCGVRDVAVHAGPMVRTAHSPLVCFAGVGPGEVCVGGAKVVGISQRRTRAAARFQCAALARWDPVPYEDLLGVPAGAVDGAAAGAGVALDRLGAAVVDALYGALAG